MRPDTRFRERLRDYDLADPVRRRSFSRQVFTAVAPRYRLITRLLSLGRDRRWKRLLIRDAAGPGDPGPGPGLRHGRPHRGCWPPATRGPASAAWT